MKQKPNMLNDFANRLFSFTNEYDVIKYNEKIIIMNHLVVSKFQLIHPLIWSQELIATGFGVIY